MPAASTRSKRRIASDSQDEVDHPEKRPRNGSVSGDTPTGDDDTPSDVVHLADRVRLSWQTKGKWKAKTPRGNTPAQRTSRMPVDPSAPSTSNSTLEMSAPVLEDGAPIVDASVPESIPSTLVEDTPATSTETKEPTEQELALQAEVAQLRKQLEQKNQLISRHESTLDVVQNSMHCAICLDPLWRPFVVVPCGHISCQPCLVSWFTSPTPDNPNADPVAPLPPHQQKHKRKTCPHCRGAVRSRPVELFGMGSVVAALVGQSGPALASGSTSPVKAVEPPAGPGAASASDPWAGLFPPPPAGRALRDEGDGILRCPSCLHEIWDGECASCGRMFSDDGSGQSDFGSGDGSISIYGDGVGSLYNGGAGSLYGGTMDGGSIDGGSDEGEGDSAYGSGPDYPQLAYVPRALAYDSYDEDEDEDDSFVDDSELPRPPPAAYFNHYVPSESDVDVDGDDDGAGGGDGYRSPPPVTLRASSEDSQFDEDDNNSEPLYEEEDDFLPPRGRRGRSADSNTADLRPRSGIETAEEADDEDDEGPHLISHSNPTSNANPNLNATVNLADSDEESDEAPIRPVGRRAAAARWGWSAQQQQRARGRRIDSPALGSESGSEEYFSD